MLFLLVLGTVILAYSSISAARKNRIAPEVGILALVLALLISVSIGAHMAGGVSITSGSAANFSITANESLESGWIFFRFLLGLILFGLMFYRPSKHAVSDMSLLRQGNRKSRSIENIVGRSIVNVTTVGLTLYTLCLFPTVGIDVISRNSYFFMASGSLSAALGTISMPLALISSTLAITSQQRHVKVLNSVIFVFLLAFEISKASRAAAGITVFTGIIFILLSRLSLAKRIFVGTALTALGSILLTSVLQLRGNRNGHGILPYWEAWSSGQLTFGPEQWASAGSNLMATVPITYLSSQKEVPANLATVSLNPLSGKMAGWYEIAPEQVLYWAVPTNAYGQVAAMGYISSIFCIFTIAGLISLSATIRSYAGLRFRPPMLLASSAMTVLTAIMFMQYSIRAGTRWLWLSLALTIAITVITRLFERGPRVASSYTSYSRGTAQHAQ